MIKYIRFFNRSYKSLYDSLKILRERYYKVEIHRKIKCGLFYGYFLVENEIKRIYKKNPLTLQKRLL